MNRSAAMLDLGLYQEAGPILDEAKRFVQMLEERSTFALLDISEGELEMALGRWKRAVRLWERGLHELKELGDLFDYGRSLTYVARFYLERGDVVQTRKILDEADTIARGLGGALLIDAIDQVRRRLPESQDAHVSSSSRTDS
jgi:tetratricopeptide (TPR) repeat protein